MKQPMMVGTFLLLLLPSLTVAESCNIHSAKKVHAYDDRKLSQSEMWTVNNLTKPECMLGCLKEKYCVSFHFSPSGPVCVALRERFEGSSVASTNAIGYQLYQTNKPLSKVGSDCELKVDCVSLPNSHCNDAVCRCDIGYGPDGDICRILTECSTFGNNFTMYKNVFLGAYDIWQHASSTYQSCPETCINTGGCQSADLDLEWNVCYTNTHTWLGVPVISHHHKMTFVFFQRECHW